MARVALNKPERIDAPIIRKIFSWVTDMEDAVPNHFYYDYRDLWRQIGFDWQPQPGEPAGDNTRGVR